MRGGLRGGSGVMRNWHNQQKPMWQDRYTLIKYIMAVFNISDESGTEGHIAQEGTAGSDTFIIGTNNGEYDPIVNGKHADGWGTDPATLGGEDQFILNNLESKTAFIANLDPSKDKIFLPEGVEKNIYGFNIICRTLQSGKRKAKSGYHIDRILAHQEKQKTY